MAIVTFIFGLGGIISFLAQRYLTKSLGYEAIFVASTVISIFALGVTLLYPSKNRWTSNEEREMLLLDSKK